MPRYTSSAHTVNDYCRLDLPDLRRAGLLCPGSRAQTQQWGHTRLIVSFELMGEPPDPYLHLYYTWGGVPRMEWVDLVPVVSAISFPNAARYLMVCPVSGLRGTVFYLCPAAGQWVHRKAVGGGRLYYPSQLATERFRWLDLIFAEDEAWKKAWRKGRKQWYRGQPTRWHARLLRLGERAAIHYPRL